MASMNTSSDNVLLTFGQVVEEFKVSPGAVRAWVASGRIKPVRREGKGGGGGGMLFARGEVGSLVYGLCPVCAGGFKRGTLRQRFCSQLCRQRYARSKASPPPAGR